MKKLIKYEKLPLPIQPLVDEFVEHRKQVDVAHSKLEDATPERFRIGKIMLDAAYDPNIREFVSAFIRKETQKSKSPAKKKLGDALISASIRHLKTRFELIDKLKENSLLPEKHDFSISKQKAIRIYPEGESPGLMRLLKKSEKNYKKLLEKLKNDKEPKK